MSWPAPVLVLLSVLWALWSPCAGVLQWSLVPGAAQPFSNSSGLTLRCAATDADAAAPPLVTWLDAADAPLQDLPGIREVWSNWSLVFRAFPPRAYSPRVHAAAYRCRAAALPPARGLIVSHPVTVQAVLDSPWSLSLVLVSPRVVRCEATPSDHVTVVAWTRDNRPLEHHDDMSLSADRRVAAVWRLHAVTTLQCRAAHHLTGQTHTSNTLTLRPTEGGTPRAPVVLYAGGVRVLAGSVARLLCAAAGEPPPQYTWSRDGGGGPQPAARGTDGLLVLGAARLQHAGRWQCRATNALGEARADVQLSVTQPLTVTIRPKLHSGEAGSVVWLECSVGGGPAPNGVQWLHNGRPAHGGAQRLTHDGAHRLPVTVTRHTAGHYQCVLTTDDDTATDSAEITLGEWSPELVYTFIEQAVRPGAALSLRCRVSGRPLPAVSWLLDGQPAGRLDAPQRSVSHWSPGADEVESRLNVSLSRATDGGRYTCRAANSRGQVEHSARLNVYGPPAVRRVPPVHVVAGLNVTVHCPYSGYPIRLIQVPLLPEISWSRDGAAVMRDALSRVSVDGSGALRLRPAAPHDGGLWECGVRGQHDQYARNELQLLVRIPPKIAGFTFPTDLIEGSSVQALCGITSGDKPVFFSWLKDGQPIPSSLQIQEKSQDGFSFLIFSHLTRKHSGGYTCIATNSAAEVSHTATLAVQVSPVWELEPQNVSVLLGGDVVIHCASKGHPKPDTVWSKEQGIDFRPVTELDFQYVTLDNGTLIISSATNYHEGRYRCRVNNGVGQGLAKTVTVTVNEGAVLEARGRNVSVRLSAALSVQCAARGDQPIAVTWTRDLGPLSSTERVSVRQQRSSSGVVSTLHISSVARTDGGVYRCRAENVYGQDEMVIFINVQESPASVGLLAVSRVWSRGAMLRWRSSEGAVTYRLQQRALPTQTTPPAPPTETEWLHIPHVHLALDNLKQTKTTTEWGSSVYVSYEMWGLQPGTIYALRVAPENEVGVGNYSEPVILRTNQEAPSEPPQDIQVQIAAPGELAVTWKAPPQQSWNGALMGYSVWWGAEGGDGGRVCSVRGWGSTSATVSLAADTSSAGGGPLRVTVRAFNARGQGPPATAAVAALDTVVESPPLAVRCAALSSESLRVWWEPLRAWQLNGYDVIYQEVTLLSVPQRRRVSSAEVELSVLTPGGNYTVWVRAHTQDGAGVAAAPVYCTTLEDVPSAPAAIHAEPDSESAVAVSWLPPAAPNGDITHYTLYYRPQRGGPTQAVRVSPSPSPWALVRGLGAAPHELWVTASTRRGQGAATDPIVCTPTPKAPARIVSFERPISAAVGSAVHVPCVAAGSPAPLTLWTRARATTPLLNDKRFQFHSAQLLIISIDEETSDNYTCVARNPWGSMRVQVEVRALAAAAVGALRVQRVRAGSATLAWELRPPHHPLRADTLTGYILEYALESSSFWSVMHVPAPAREWTLRALWCGGRYRARVTALGVMGRSNASEEVQITTPGGRSPPPPLDEMLSANSSCVEVNLLSWDTAGCGVTGWEVSVRGEWEAAWRTHRAAAAAGAATMCALRPAQWYRLTVTPLAAAPRHPALYRFSTLTVHGERIPPMGSRDWSATDGAVRVAGGLLLLLLLLLAAALVAVLCRRRCGAPPPAPPAKAGSPRPRASQQLYSCSPGKLANTPDLYEISPYATFSMPAAAPPLADKQRSTTNPEEYTLSRALTLAVRRQASDSESSGSPSHSHSHSPVHSPEQSPCRACSRSRRPVAAVTDSSTESADTRSKGAADRRRRHRRHHNPTATASSNRHVPTPRSDRSDRSDHEPRDFTIHV